MTAATSLPLTLPQNSPALVPDVTPRAAAAARSPFYFSSDRPTIPSKKKRGLRRLQAKANTDPLSASKHEAVESNLQEFHSSSSPLLSSCPPPPSHIISSAVRCCLSSTPPSNSPRSQASSSTLDPRPSSLKRTRQEQASKHARTQASREEAANLSCIHTRQTPSPQLRYRTSKNQPPLPSTHPRRAVY